MVVVEMPENSGDERGLGRILCSVMPRPARFRAPTTPSACTSFSQCKTVTRQISVLLQILPSSDDQDVWIFCRLRLYAVCKPRLGGYRLQSIVNSRDWGLPSESTRVPTRKSVGRASAHSLTRQRRAAQLATAALAMLAGATACVIHPEADVQAPEFNPSSLAPGEMVAVLSDLHTQEQASFVDCIMEEMREAAPELAIMPAREFRDALYPWFEPATTPDHIDELTALLGRPAVKRRIEELDVRYVAVVGGRTDSENEGAFGCAGAYAGAGCLGVGTEDRHSHFSAAVWDLKQGNSAGAITAQTSGTSVFIGVIVPIMFFSATESATCDALGKRLADFMTGKTPVKLDSGGTAPEPVLVK